MRLLNQSLTEYVFIMIDLNEDFNFMLTKGKCEYLQGFKIRSITYLEDECNY